MGGGPMGAMGLPLSPIPHTPLGSQPLSAAAASGGPGLLPHAPMMAPTLGGGSGSFANWIMGGAGSPHLAGGGHASATASGGGPADPATAYATQHLAFMQQNLPRFGGENEHSWVRSITGGGSKSLSGKRDATGQIRTDMPDEDYAATDRIAGGQVR